MKRLDELTPEEKKRLSEFYDFLMEDEEYLERLEREDLRLVKEIEVLRIKLEDAEFEREEALADADMLRDEVEELQYELDRVS